VKRSCIFLCVIPFVAFAQWQVVEKDRLEARIEIFYRAMFSLDLETMYALHAPLIRSTIDFESWKKDIVVDENGADALESTIRQFDIQNYDWCGDYGKEFRCIVVVHLVVGTDGVVEEGDLKALWIYQDDDWYFGMELHH